MQSSASGEAHGDSVSHKCPLGWPREGLVAAWPTSLGHWEGDAALPPPCFSYFFAVAPSLFPLGCRRPGSRALGGRRTSVSWIPGATCEAGGQSLPSVRLMLCLPTVTRAEVKEGIWLAINRLVKGKDYPSSCEY